MYPDTCMKFKKNFLSWKENNCCSQDYFWCQEGLLARTAATHPRRVPFYTLAYPSLCNVNVYWKALLTVFSVLSSLFAVAAVSGVMYVCIHGAANLLQLNAETAAPYCIVFSCGKQVDCCWTVIVDSGWHRLYKLLTYAVLLRMNVCVNFTTTTSLF